MVKQRLSGKLPSRVSADSVVGVVRDLAYVQWDPVSIVGPSHLLALWSRLGRFPPSLLDRLLWEEKRLFEHWIPFAALVLTEDYPIYSSLMRRYPESLSSSWGRQRAEARKFLAEHSALRRRLIAQLRDGPRTTSGFAEHRRNRHREAAWSSGSDVALMLYHLLMGGQVMIVGHDGSQNLWGLADRFLPPETVREELSTGDVEQRAAERAIRALGTATPTEINHHYVRGMYQDLAGTLGALEGSSSIQRVRIEGFPAREERYIHATDLPLLEALEAGAWEPRTSLLPPFDNLIADPARTQRLFGFGYVREQFLPAAKRRYGTYVLPVLSGDRLVGRIDPQFDKGRQPLEIRAIHAEPAAEDERELAPPIAESIADLGRFLGAREVRYPARVPSRWRHALR